MLPHYPLFYHVHNKKLTAVHDNTVNNVHNKITKQYFRNSLYIPIDYMSTHIEGSKKNAYKAGFIVGYHSYGHFIDKLRR
ncbi:hypothetical protein PAAL109150_17780 [Paenibacillus alkaliterrae]